MAALSLQAHAQEDRVLRARLDNLSAKPPGLIDASPAVADLDGDGDLDLLLIGRLGVDEGGYAQVFMQADTIFVRSPSREFLYTDVEITPLWLGSSAFGDLDGDGLPDLITTGLGEAGGSIAPQTHIYLNRSPEADVLRFSPAGTLGNSLPDLYGGTVALAPTDPGASSPYAIACGARSTDALDERPHSGLYRIVPLGQQIRFDPLPLDAPDLTMCAAAWSDYDDDGDPDFAISGNQKGAFFSALYRNDGGTFTRTADALERLAYGSIDWGDYDSDGDPDLLMTGGALDPRLLRGVTALYRNDGGLFTRIETTIPGVVRGAARFVDTDGNDKLDIVLAGESSPVGPSVFGLYFADSLGGFTENLIPAENVRPFQETDSTIVIRVPMLGITRASVTAGGLPNAETESFVVTGIIDSRLVAPIIGGLTRVREDPVTYHFRTTVPPDQATPNEAGPSLREQ